MSSRSREISELLLTAFHMILLLAGSFISLYYSRIDFSSAGLYLLDVTNSEQGATFSVMGTTGNVSVRIACWLCVEEQPERAGLSHPRRKLSVFRICALHEICRAAFEHLFRRRHRGQVEALGVEVLISKMRRYSVDICPRPCCNCPDFLRRASACKHVIMAVSSSGG